MTASPLLVLLSLDQATLLIRPQRLHLSEPEACVKGPYFAPQPRQIR